MTGFEKRMCLSSQCRRGSHWQQRPLFVGVLVGESEMTVCLPQLLWQLARGRNAQCVALAIYVEGSGELSWFERVAGNAAQDVR